MLDTCEKNNLVTYHSYRDLDIYKKAHKLAVEIHKMTLTLPKFEMYEAGSDIRRSSKSVKNSIVEGFGRRRYKQEFIRFLSFSQGSCDETTEHLVTLYDTGSLTDEKQYKYFMEEYDHLGRMINNFIKSVERNHLTGEKELGIAHRESSNEHRESEKYE
jgi:four helix bundle protein